MNNSNVLILGDLHFGNNSNSGLFQDIQKEAFTKFILPLIDEKDIQTVYITGDVFHSRDSINIQILNHCMDMFEMMENAGCQIEIIGGNHDSYYNNNFSITSLRMFDRWPAINYHTQIETTNIGGKSVMMVPYLQTKEDVNNFTKIVKKTCPDICLGHFEINKFYLTVTREEKNGMGQKLFKENTGKTISGHFHIRDKKGNITYVGVPYPLNWNDHDNVKGVHILNVDNMRIQFHENTVSPRFIKVDHDFVVDGAERDVKKTVENNFIKVIIDRKISQEKMQEMLNYVESMSPKSVTPVYTGDYIREESQIDEEAISSSHIDLLSEYVDKAAIPEGIKKDEMRGFLTDLYDEATETV